MPPGAGVLVSPSYVGRPATRAPVDGVESPSTRTSPPTARARCTTTPGPPTPTPGPGRSASQARGRHGLVRRRGVRDPRLRHPRPDRRALRRPGRAAPARARPRVDAARWPPATCRTGSTSTARRPGRTSAAAPTSTSTSGTGPWSATTDRRMRGRRDADADGEPDLTLDETYDVERRGRRRRLPDRADARLGRAGSGSRPRRAASACVDPETDEVRSRSLERGDRQLVLHRRERRRVRRDHRRALPPLGRRAGRPRGDWRRSTTAGSEQKPGQLSQGSGTTPTLLPDGLVAITDNAEPRMHVLFLRRDTGEEVCQAPVFEDDASATDNSLVAVGPAASSSRTTTATTARSARSSASAPAPGFARVDVVDGSARSRGPATWSRPRRSPRRRWRPGCSTPTPSGTLWGVSAWYLTAIDARPAATSSASARASAPR